MANDYYDALCLDMDACMRAQNYEQVVARMNEELSMPYVPLAYEHRFEQYRKDARAFLSAGSTVKKEIMDVETFASLMQDSSLEVQLLGIEGLRQMNYVPYVPIIAKYLANPMYEEVQSLLVYELIERGVREEFTTKKDGFEVVFTPYYLELPQESDSFMQCVVYIEDAVEKNPSLCQLCLQVLQVLYMKRLPLSYDEDEVNNLGASIIFYACTVMQDEEMWQQVKTRFSIQEADLINIVLD